MLINPIGTLRQLKGAPLSILIALTIVKPRLVSSTWLCGCTGYSSDAVTSGTWYLKELGFIECDSHRTNWRLTEEGTQQLPLPVSMLPENPDPEKPDPVSTTTTLISKNDLTEGSSSSFKSPDPEKPDPDSRLALLRHGGIFEPTATELCRLEHASYVYLEAHIQKASLDGIETSLLVHRIREADPKPILPGSNEDRDRYLLCENCSNHPSNCNCDNQEE